ncbi:rod shape-determining protein MreD [Sphingomonas sp. R86520]|uniref:rod shape-determining protein MreD n=1 Tax=Sphingomonas sp. R86520 TaxID=3093859 RepID=UPI0036D26046
MMPPRVVDSVDYKPFETKLPAGRSRAIPWATVMVGSLFTIIPVIATIPLLPPFGLVMLLAWRLLARFAFRPWAAAPLGFFDDLVSGQPLGSAVLLWSLAFVAIDMIEQRLAFRDHWQDWLIASGLIAASLLAGRFIAVPVGAHVDTVLLAQIVVTMLVFPLAARIVAAIQNKRGTE